MKRLLVLVLVLPVLMGLPSCGGGSSNPNTGQVSQLTHRAFISNNFAGNIQIVDTQTDMTAFTTQQTVNSAGQQITTSIPVVINVGGQLTWETLAPNSQTTAVYASNNNGITFLTNSSETIANAATLGASASGPGVFSPDSSTIYVPENNLPVSGQRSGGIQSVSLASAAVANSYPVASAIGVAVSTSGRFLMAFSDSSDAAIVIDTQANTVTYTAINGLARPVNAFFTSDSTAYVLNCGPECGSTAGPASVSQVNISTATVAATVPVGGATVGLLKGNNLYVAGNPGPAGTVDIVDISNMTRSTPNSIPISDGYHASLAITNNNKLYIGAITCSNVTTGCLSAVNLTNNTPDAPIGPTGNVTALLAIANRNVLYVIQNGYLAIYDTTTNTLQATQIVFTGALNDIVQIEQ